MGVRISRTELIEKLESTLDYYEEYIGTKIWNDLSQVYDELNVSISELENENQDLKDEIKRLNRQIDEMEEVC